MPFRIASASGGGGTKSFTPTVTLATPGTFSATYATRLGTYVRVGSLYIFTINLAFTPTIGTGTGQVRISGLPATATAQSVATVGEFNESWDVIPQFYGLIAASTNYIALRIAGGNGFSVDDANENAFDDGQSHTLALTGILFA